MTRSIPKQHVLLVPDGAADRIRLAGKSPLALARTPYMDFIARQGVTGLAQTLYEDLPRESMVALLGILGWDPRRYYPHGRSSSELLASGGGRLGKGDLAFRANFVRMCGNRLASYNADYVHTDQAKRLVDAINAGMREEFPRFELCHNSDFRNTLVLRGARCDPRRLECPLPHESQGKQFDLCHYVAGSDPQSQATAESVNAYICRARDWMNDRHANAVLPWSPSTNLDLPLFHHHCPTESRVAVVGAMDFLAGICLAGGIEFVKRGNGRPDTDFAAKGSAILDLLHTDAELVVCHINAPDEASHMGNVELKIGTIEAIDRDVAGPVVEYFHEYPERLGGVMILPDHFSNTLAATGCRSEAHSMDPVPFALWNNQHRDASEEYSEDGVTHGRYASPIAHLSILKLLTNKTGLPVAAYA